MSTIFIPEDLKRNFKEFIASRSGLYFKDHNLKDLEEKIVRRMVVLGMESPLSYYSHLTTSKSKEDELRELFNILTINHTYFFRNEEQFDVLRKKVLPEIIRRRSYEKREVGQKPVIRIWSAGCSTGEEPYSIAMAVREAIPNIDEWDVQIIATDASGEALAKAKKGFYRANSIKSIDKEHLSGYFHSVPSGEYEINDGIKKMVSFGFHNLVGAAFPGNFDIIFCRNVVIYFEFETTFEIMKRFYDSLTDEGCIFIGYSETLHFMQDKFKMIAADDAIYYLKVTRDSHFEKTEMSGERSAEKCLDDIVEELARKEVLAEFDAKSEPALGEEVFSEDIMIEATKNFHLKKYNEALRLVERVLANSPNAPEARFLAAEIHLNRGNTREARGELERVLLSTPFFVPAHYLLGCINMEEGFMDDARASFKKALYLEKDFTLASFYLADIYKKQGRMNEAIREYRNTVKLLSKAKPSDIIPFSGGIVTASLMGVCRDNIERIKMGE
jgi:chemotaxis protein methyltransferase CheR